jgi:hypothetical protein
MGQGEFTYVGFVYRASGIKGDTNAPSFASKSATSVRSEAREGGFVMGTRCRVWGRRRLITLSIDGIHDDGKGISRGGSTEITR